MKKTIPVLALCLIAFSVAVSSQEPDIMAAGRGVTNIFGGLMCGVVCLLAYIISAVACIVLVLAGVKYLTAEDPAERDEAKKRIWYALIGLVFFFVAMPFANYITGGLIAPFNCGCLPASGVISPPTPPKPGGFRVMIIEPKDHSEYETDSSVDFMSKAYGGSSPYSYNWTSSVDGFLESSDSFSRVLARGTHKIKVEATDSAGQSASAEVEVNIIIPKPKPEIALT